MQLNERRQQQFLWTCDLALRPDAIINDDHVPFNAIVPFLNDWARALLSEQCASLSSSKPPFLFKFISTTSIRAHRAGSKDRILTLTISDTHGTRVTCSCSFSRNFLIACRHLIAWKGALTLEDIHIRWLKDYNSGDLTSDHRTLEYIGVLAPDNFAPEDVPNGVEINIQNDGAPFEINAAVQDILTTNLETQDTECIDSNKSFWVQAMRRLQELTTQAQKSEDR